MDKTAAMLEILRDEELFEKTGGSGVLGTAANVVRAIDRGGRASAEFLASKGHTRIAKGARIAPHLATLYAGKMAYDSGPAQKLRRKYRAHKIRKAMRQAQRGY